MMDITAIDKKIGTDKQLAKQAFIEMLSNFKLTEMGNLLQEIQQTNYLRFFIEAGKLNAEGNILQEGTLAFVRNIDDNKSSIVKTTFGMITPLKNQFSVYVSNVKTQLTVYENDKIVAESNAPKELILSPSKYLLQVDDAFYQLDLSLS